MDILDASALICLIKGEKGHETVANLLKKNKSQKAATFIHQINLCEVERE